MKYNRDHLLFGLLFALSTTLPLACGDGDGDGSGGGTGGASGGCTADEDCGEGLVCSASGTCVQCRGDGDCGRAQRCDSSTLACVFRDGWGDECTVHDDCPASMFCVQGLCTPSELVVYCGGLGQCPEGMRCNRPLQVCEEDLGCFSNDDCLEGEVCNPGTGACEPSCTEENEIEVCQAGERCLEGRCVECAQDDDCGPGLVCNTNAGRCAGPLTCFSDRDCEAGKVCNRATSTCTVAPPPCRSDADCLEDERCDLERGGRCVLRACLPDQDEPNDDAANATPIGTGRRTELSLCGSDEDWFRIALRSGDRINVNIDADVLVAGGLDAQIVDPDGRTLARDPYLLDATVTRTDDHFLRFRTWDAQARYGFNVIVVRGEPCEDDGWEENDEAAAAPTLAPGVHENLLACPADPDWYLVEVPAGRGISVELEHDPLRGDLDLFLFDTNGRTLLDLSSTTEPVERVQAPGVTGGRAYIQVRSSDARTKNEYDLRIVLQ